MAENSLIQIADELRKIGDFTAAIDAYQRGIEHDEQPNADICLKLSRCCLKTNQPEQAFRWLMKLVDSSAGFGTWQGAGAVLTQILRNCQPPSKRSVKLAVLGSYTTTQWIPMLQLAGWRQGIALDIQEAPFGQYQQQIIDKSSDLYSFCPDLVVIATHHGEIQLPEFSDHHEKDVATEVQRWVGLWNQIQDHCEARVIQHNFALPPDCSLGHLSSRLSGSKQSMLAEFNAALGIEAGDGVSIVDCARIASSFGTSNWFNDAYWHRSKQAVALDALPLLAQHTIAVVAASLGLSKKCLVLDLDNTLWGGVIGEDGLNGIGLGGADPVGEAFVSFQNYILQLKNKGVILAVCSKNNEADAKEPFNQHPDMRIGLDDISMFVANWIPKPENIRQIATTLNIGLDSLVFVDDNPAEREIVRQMLPEVDVITLPADAFGYRRALGEYLMFETDSFTKEDAKRTEQYRAKAKIADLQVSAESIEVFYQSLQMQGIVAPFDEFHLPRIVQLIGKTNQFNLTTRRHTLSHIKQFIADPNCVHLYLKLQDRFTDHGLVSLIIANKKDDVLDIDTWLMSCRVIGRTVEAEMLSHLCQHALALGCSQIRGTYIPTAKNAMVIDVFGRCGFMKLADQSGTTTWEYDLRTNAPINNGFIEISDRTVNDAA